MAVLITGAGLIGCQTAALLAARGDKVVLLDLRAEPLLVSSVLPLERVTLEAGDVRDRAAMHGIFRRLKCEVVH